MDKLDNLSYKDLVNSVNNYLMSLGEAPVVTEEAVKIKRSLIDYGREKGINPRYFLDDNVITEDLAYGLDKKDLEGIYKIVIDEFAKENVKDPYLNPNLKEFFNSSSVEKSKLEEYLERFKTHSKNLIKVGAPVAAAALVMGAPAAAAQDDHPQNYIDFSDLPENPSGLKLTMSEEGCGYKKYGIFKTIWEGEGYDKDFCISKDKNFYIDPKPIALKLSAEKLPSKMESTKEHSKRIKFLDNYFDNLKSVMREATEEEIRNLLPTPKDVAEEIVSGLSSKDAEKIKEEADLIQSIKEGSISFCPEERILSKMLQETKKAREDMHHLTDKKEETREEGTTKSIYKIMREKADNKYYNEINKVPGGGGAYNILMTEYSHHSCENPGYSSPKESGPWITNKCGGKGKVFDADTTVSFLGRNFNREEDISSKILDIYRSTYGTELPPNYQTLELSVDEQKQEELKKIDEFASNFPVDNYVNKKVTKEHQKYKDNLEKGILWFRKIGSSNGKIAVPKEVLNEVDDLKFKDYKESINFLEDKVNKGHILYKTNLLEKEVEEDYGPITKLMAYNEMSKLEKIRNDIKEDNLEKEKADKTLSQVETNIDNIKESIIYKGFNFIGESSEKIIPFFNKDDKPEKIGGYTIEGDLPGDVKDRLEGKKSEEGFYWRGQYIKYEPPLSTAELLSYTILGGATMFALAYWISRRY